VNRDAGLLELRDQGVLVGQDVGDPVLESFPIEIWGRCKEELFRTPSAESFDEMENPPFHHASLSL
jgi:hypothetical protein